MIKKNKKVTLILLAMMMAGSIMTSSILDVTAAQADAGTTAATDGSVPADEQAEEGKDKSVTDAAGAADNSKVTSIGDFILGTDPSLASDPQLTAPKVPDAQYSKLYHYNTDVVFSGIYKTNSLSFKIQDYWDLKYAYAQIEYNVSPMIKDVPASLTFFVNDSPIYSCAVDYSDGGTQITYASIPVELLKKGFNNFQITGYVRLYDEDGCLDDFSGANWVEVTKASQINVGYDINNTDNSLKYFPFPFISSIDESGSELNISVPEKVDDNELKAAVLLRAGLGDETDTRDDISLTYLGDETGVDHKKQIIVASYKDLPEEYKSMMPSDVTAEGGCAVYEYSEKERTVLVVTANDSKDLYEGVAMLLDDTRVTQEDGSYASVASGAADTVISNSKLSDLIVSEDSIKGITGQDGLEFVGPFRQEQVVYLPLSGGFVLADGGKINLNFRYSDNLNFDRSLITVYWGSTPVASKKLSRENASGDSFSFVMPEDVVGTYAGNVTIAFDLEIPDLYCTKRADQMPWAYVSGNSTLYLPVGKSSTYSFDVRPYPFEEMGLFNDLTLVVPDEMSSVDLQMAGRIAAIEGSALSPYGSFEVKKASETGELKKEGDTAADRNIIAVGTANDNSFIAELNNDLSINFTDDLTAFNSNSQILFSDTYAKNICVLQIIRSPYAGKRAVMVAAAPSEDALSNAVEYLRSQENCWELSNDAFVIDKDGQTRSFTYLSENKETGVSIKDKLIQNKNAVIMTLVSTLAMVIMLIGMIIVLYRYNKNRRQDKKK